MSVVQSNIDIDDAAARILNLENVQKDDGSLVDSIRAFNHAHLVVGGRWPEGEADIARSSEYSLKYARNVLLGPSPAGEKAIATDPWLSAQYAHQVLKGRFPLGEAAIRTNAFATLYYARNVVKARWPEGEPILLQDDSAACVTQYVHEVIKGPWPEAEPLLAKHPQSALLYAIYAVKGRFLLGEPVIFESPSQAKAYFKRWPEAKREALAMGRLDIVTMCEAL